MGARCAAAPAPWELTAPLFAEIEAAESVWDAPDEVTAMQTADILTWLQQDILLKADKMSMASSLELRVPFLDREVFALASTLPAAQRVGRHENEDRPARRRGACCRKPRPPCPSRASSPRSPSG